jgi:mRNA-degrading endonuclease RelE of RelBE toxin-antitoxin system
MPSRKKYELVFAPETFDHLDAIDQKYHRSIEDTANERLGFTPEVETRNRKPLEQPAPAGAAWELRCGPGNRFRLFYEVHDEELEVWILAIGVKERQRLFIGGEEFKP